MSEPEHPAATDLRAAITAYAEDCRRAYRASPTPTVTVVPAELYTAIKAAVAEGTAPDWLAAEFRAGRYVPAGWVLVDEASAMSETPW